MGYVEKNLMPEEKIITTGQIHWIVFAPGVVLLLLGGVFVFEKSTVFGSFLIVIAIYRLITAALVFSTTELAVTSKRVIAKFGFIKRETIELNLKKVESLNVSQGMIGRILSYGTIVINGTGGIKTPIPSIVDPLEFRRKTAEQIALDQA